MEGCFAPVARNLFDAIEKIGPCFRVRAPARRHRPLGGRTRRLNGGYHPDGLEPELHGGPSPRNMLDARDEESRRLGRAFILAPETPAVSCDSEAGGRPIAKLRKSLIDQPMHDGQPLGEMKIQGRPGAIRCSPRIGGLIAEVCSRFPLAGTLSGLVSHPQETDHRTNMLYSQSTQ